MLLPNRQQGTVNLCTLGLKAPLVCFKVPVWVIVCWNYWTALKSLMAFYPVVAYGKNMEACTSAWLMSTLKRLVLSTIYQKLCFTPDVKLGTAQCIFRRKLTANWCVLQDSCEQDSYCITLPGRSSWPAWPIMALTILASPVNSSIMPLTLWTTTFAPWMEATPSFHGMGMIIAVIVVEAGWR